MRHLKHPYELSRLQSERRSLVRPSSSHWTWPSACLGGTSGKVPRQDPKLVILVELASLRLGPQHWDSGSQRPYAEGQEHVRHRSSTRSFGPDVDILFLWLRRLRCSHFGLLLVLGIFFFFFSLLYLSLGRGRGTAPSRAEQSLAIPSQVPTIEHKRDCEDTPRYARAPDHKSLYNIIPCNPAYGPRRC